MPMTSATTELAYGLLWIVGCDRSTDSGQALYLARKALYEQLDRDGQARGITAARTALVSDPPLRAGNYEDRHPQDECVWWSASELNAEIERLHSQIAIIPAQRTGDQMSHNPASIDVGKRDMLFCLAQLRHVYQQLTEGAVRNQKQFAEGLIAPQIRTLETFAASVSPQESLTIEQCIKAIEAQDAGYLSCDPVFERGYRAALQACLKAVRALAHSQEVTTSRDAKDLRALWLALNGGPKPLCRDCADEHGTCPGDKLPCDPQERALKQIADLRGQVETMRTAALSSDERS